ncbi:periplasmic heavy metal sensor [Propylenella binzhouense]|uniref:Periplasmic heavy metal sensor n=1 Tax=Propylenella binzhouense TaxID=2555902 RepID=A0A964WTG4_9HYPH|nr:periplasmic heavy metal sensor [Propylenella binzhouense]MYZ47974.1 periplasmic heavy metal sensor [Propylenella binzhouense]
MIAERIVPSPVNWPAVLLAASLALNGVLAGILVTGQLRAERHVEGVSRPLRLELKGFAGRLPAESLDKVTAELAPLEPQVDRHIAELRRLRSEITRLAAAPSPDRAAIAERFAAIRAEVAALQTLVQGATLDAVLSLPPEVRAELAEPPR